MCVISRRIDSGPPITYNAPCRMASANSRSENLPTRSCMRLPVRAAHCNISSWYSKPSLALAEYRTTMSYPSSSAYWMTGNSGVIPIPPAYTTIDRDSTHCLDDERRLCPSIKRRYLPYGPTTSTDVPGLSAVLTSRVKSPSARMANVMSPAAFGRFTIENGCIERIPRILGKRRNTKSPSSQPSPIEGTTISTCIVSPDNAVTDSTVPCAAPNRSRSFDMTYHPMIATAHIFVTVMKTVFSAMYHTKFI